MVLAGLPLALDPFDRDFDTGDAFELAVNTVREFIGHGKWLGLISLLLPSERIDLHSEPIGIVNDDRPSSRLHHGIVPGWYDFAIWLLGGRQRFSVRAKVCKVRICLRHLCLQHPFSAKAGMQCDGNEI